MNGIKNQYKAFENYFLLIILSQQFPETIDSQLRLVQDGSCHNLNILSVPVSGNIILLIRNGTSLNVL